MHCRQILYHLNHQASPSGPLQSPGKTRVPEALPQPLSFLHQSCPSKALGSMGEEAQMWTPHPTPARRVLVLESWPGGQAPQDPPTPTHQAGRGPDTPSSTTHSALSTGSCHHGPWPLPEPVPSLVLSLGCPSSRFLSGARSALPPKNVPPTTWLPNEYLLWDPRRDGRSHLASEVSALLL